MDQPIDANAILPGQRCGILANAGRDQANTNLERYVERGHRRVEGWLHPFSAHFIAHLARIQRRLAIAGAVAEIGIHHGRLFILLHLANGCKRSLAIDIFEDQHLNVDKSGRGNLERFLSNLARCGGDIAGVSLFKKSSLAVTPQEIVERVGPVVLFSVDGGHTAECAEHDLRLAQACLHEDGVVILDDFFNEVWPEVCVGAIRYLTDKATALRPFAISPNKLYLCRPGCNGLYRQELRKALPHRAHDKDVTMFGSPVAVMGAVKYGPLARIRHAIADSRLGPAIRAMMGK